MTAILIINAIILGAVGVLYSIWGSNAPSRLLGIVCLISALINAGALTGLVNV